jgi:hypothetical protein
MRCDVDHRDRYIHRDPMDAEFAGSPGGIMSLAIKQKSSERRV